MIKDKLKLVYDDDLVKYLKSIGYYDSIIEGKNLCRFCGAQITIENLEIIVPNENVVEFICSNKNCLNQL
ncbi:MAG: hypothetical protein PHX62_07740 [Bacilli bacterium]|nr:hypothetical protein [Bacilli bacterium]